MDELRELLPLLQVSARTVNIIALNALTNFEYSIEISLIVQE